MNRRQYSVQQMHSKRLRNTKLQRDPRTRRGQRCWRSRGLVLGGAKLLLGLSQLHAIQLSFAVCLDSVLDGLIPVDREIEESHGEEQCAAVIRHDVCL